MRRIIALAIAMLMITSCGEGTTADDSTTSPREVTTTSSATITTEITTTSEAELLWPPPLVAPGLVYDERNNALLLFGGGHSSTASNNNTWLFNVDDRTWVRLNPSMRPPSRTLAALAYDTQSELVVMTGGDPGPAGLFSTWICHSDQQDWRMAGRGPISKEREQQERITNGLIGAPIAYDAESDRTVLFGGALYVGNPDDPVSRDFVFLDETWVYDADTNSWEDMNPDVAPLARVDHGMAYDPESDRILVWGGFPQEALWDLTPDALVDPSVWAYDHNTNTWTEHINDDGPQPAKYDGPFTFDIESDRMVVIREDAEVWAYHYNTNTWTQQPAQSTQPIKTAFSGITYIGGSTDRVALYGGCIRLTDNYAEFGLDFSTYCSNELWFYDLNTNIWEKIGPPGS